MMDEWIQAIRLKNKDNDAGEWRYQVSGNAIELSVPRNVIHNKEAYRCSVITIGQVLKILAQKIEEAEFQYLIQSFPNLENPQVIASIRMDSSKHTRVPFPDLATAGSPLEPVHKLRTIAEKYQFELDEVTEAGEVFPRGITIQNGGRCYALFSRFDNPFTWLNLGYLKAGMSEPSGEQPFPEPRFIVDFCNSSERINPLKTNVNANILQALIIL
jgi:hypothetical protein